jgi:hypothetical protein
MSHSCPTGFPDEDEIIKNLKNVFKLALQKGEKDNSSLEGKRHYLATWDFNVN